MTVKLLVKRVGLIKVPLPQYQTKGAVGLDLHAAIGPEGGGLSIRPGEHRAIPTGLAFAIPEGYEGTVRARSGHARDYAVTVTNGVGTIDLTSAASWRCSSSTWARATSGSSPWSASRNW